MLTINEPKNKKDLNLINLKLQLYVIMKHKYFLSKVKDSARISVLTPSIQYHFLDSSLSHRKRGREEERERNKDKRE
jgi:hypothetical protein